MHHFSNIFFNKNLDVYPKNELELERQRKIIGSYQSKLQECTNQMDQLANKLEQLSEENKHHRKNI
jgi:prefoldin subunit 5